MINYQHEILAVREDDGQYCHWCNTGISVCPGCGEEYHEPELNSKGFCQDCVHAEDGFN